MTANNALRVTETDFDTIKENLKNYLRTQNQFQDYDFEGSGMSVLLDILSYNTHYMAYYLNMVANESFLDSAQLRSSIISHAKVINYVPESKHASSAILNVVVTPTNTESGNSVVTMEKYTRLLGSDIDGVNYPFVVMNTQTASKISNTFTFNNVQIKQGEVITLQYAMDASNVKRRFKIPSANCDTDTITVLVQESAANTEISEYVLSTDITLIDNTSKVYFVEEDVDGTYVVYFGDGVLGKKPTNGNIIIISYLDTVGSPANKLASFTFSDRIGGLFSDNVSVTATSTSYAGAEKETIEETRSRAPLSYVTQNRAVTKMDYETLLTKDYDNIEALAVWGGEENVPPIYGKVYLAIKTKDDYFLTNVEKENIKNSLIENRNVLTVVPEIVDPSYMWLMIRGAVYYNAKLASATANDIDTFVRAAIDDYKNDDLNKFTGIFRKSKLQQYMESSDAAITGSDINILAQKRVTVTLFQTKNYIFDFGVPITRGSITSALTTYPQVAVLDKNNLEKLVFFEEVPSIDSGINSIKITNSGINYSVAPSVTILGDGAGATAIAKLSGGRVTSIEITNKGTGYTRAFVSFSGGDGAGVQAEAVLDNRVGTLRSYYIEDSGQRIVVNSNAGTIDYVNGLVTLTSLNARYVGLSDYYDENVLTMIVPIAKEIILPLRNRILDIDGNDPLAIQISIVSEQ